MPKVHRVLDKLVLLSKKAKSKIVAGVASSSVFAMSAAAAPAISNTGAVTGDLDVGPFMGMAGLVVVALGAMWAVKRGLALIRG